MPKRKLNLILRTKSTNYQVIDPGDLVQLFIKNGHKNRGRCLSTRVVQQFDNSDGTVSSRGSNGRNVVPAFEDTRMAIVNDDFVASMIESIDNLSDEISESLDIEHPISLNYEKTPVSSNNDEFVASFDDINTGINTIFNEESTRNTTRTATKNVEADSVSAATPHLKL